MESFTDNIQPLRKRFFRITSRWRSKLSEAHYGYSKPQEEDKDVKVISTFDSNVEVSGVGIGSLGLKEIGSSKIQPEHPVHSSNTANTDSFTPPVSRNGPLLKAKDTITCIRQSFHPQTANKPMLLEICYSLARIPSERIPNTKVTKRKHFQKSPIKLRIKTLGNKEYKILLPCTQADPGLSVAENEEQRDGGSCDRFIGMLPESCWDISQKASPLGLVPKLLPHGRVGGNVRYIASCFWIWLCVVDDLTESLVGRKWEETESDLMQVFANTTKGHYYNAESDAIKVSRALRSVIDTTEIASNDPQIISDSWRGTFRSAIREVITGFQAERPLLGTKITLSAWMRVRMVTISARPFMILVKASLGLDLVLSNFGNPLIGDCISLGPGRRECDTILAKVECLLQLIMGLQNDILGWEKDFKVNNSLNTIQILIQGGMDPDAAMEAVIGTHNKLVQHLSDYGERAWVESLSTGPSLVTDDTINLQASYWGSIFRCYYSKNSAFGMGCDLKKDLFMPQRRHSIPGDNIQKYLEIIVGFANGMASWMLASKRYAA